MERVESTDGTSLALDRSGSGPPLVIVVGAFCDRSTSKSLTALLGSSYTVYEYDRRGRGDSDKDVAFSVDLEVEDLKAVIAATGQTPFVYGHSSGGSLALEAAARGVDMRRLAVYEPPYTGDAHPSQQFGLRLDELVTSGHRDQAAEQWLAMTGAPAHVIESIKSGPRWAHMQALTHTLSQDLRLANNGQVPMERFARIGVPVLAIAGGASPPWAASVAATVACALPRASEQILDGQTHTPADPVVVAILERFFQ
jgi:pimeloyl-ACP methyl ester carboxylesterase